MQVGEGDQAEVDQAIGASVARRAIHNVGFPGFVRHGNGGDHVRTEIDAQDEHSRQRFRNLHGDVAQERSDFRNVGRKRVRDRLLEVVEDETTFFDAVDDGREVVIHKDHIGSFLGNILTGDTHSNADVTLLEGRGVVDTVAGDGDDFTASLAVFNDEKLMSRGYASPDDLFVIESGVPLGALGNRIFNLSPFTNVVTLDDNGGAVVDVLLVDDVHLLGDGGGGDRVITGDHVHLDASAVALQHGFRNTFARRINERKETDEGEVINREVRLRLLRKLEVVLEARKFLVGETEDALTAATEFFVRGRVLGLERSILGAHFTLGEVRGALGQDALRSTLEHKKWRLAARLRVDGELPLVGGVELDLKQLRVRGTRLQSVVEGLHQLEQTLLRGIARRRLLQNVEVRVHHLSLEVDKGTIFLLGQVLSVVTQSGDLEETLERFRLGVVERFTIRRLTRFRDHLEIWNVLTRRAEVDVIIVPGVLHSHAVLRERTRLIGSDDSRRAERFDSFEVLHENILGVHTLGSQSQRHGHGGEQTFRHVRDDDTDDEHNVRDDISTVGQIDDEEDDAEGDGDVGDETDESGNFLVDRRRLTGGFRGETGDLTHDGAVTATDDDTAAGTRVDDGRVEAQVGGFERLGNEVTRGVTSESRRTILRFRLTRQR